MMTPAKLEPSNVITTVHEEIGKHLLKLVSQLGYEAEEIEEQWEALGRAGGQRDDHAAALMTKLEPHLRDIATFAECCRDQVLAMHADPFGRKE